MVDGILPWLKLEAGTWSLPGRVHGFQLSAAGFNKRVSPE
jgi:hypothetical protein